MIEEVTLGSGRTNPISPRSRNGEPTKQSLLATETVTDKFISCGSAIFSLMEREAEKAKL